MMSSDIKGKSTFERIRLFSGLIATSLVVVIVAFYAIKLHEDNNNLKKEINNKNIASVKLLNAKVEYTYRLVGEIENIIINNGDPVLRGQVMPKVFNLANELVVVDKELKNINQNIAKSNNLYSGIYFSIVENAFADNNADDTNNQQGFRMLYFALGVITVILIFSFILMLTSTNEKIINFSIDTIKLIIGCFVGIITGKVVN